MYLVAIAWIYVVLMMAVAEATATNGTVLGAIFTFVLYGALPLAVVLYIMRSPARRAKRKAQEALEELSQPQSTKGTTSAQPDAGGHAAGATGAPNTQGTIPPV